MLTRYYYTDQYILVIDSQFYIERFTTVMRLDKWFPFQGKIAHVFLLPTPSPLSSLASSLSCVFFFFSGSHPNSISYQVTNAICFSRSCVTTFSVPLVVFWFSFLLYLFRVLSSAFLHFIEYSPFNNCHPCTLGSMSGSCPCKCFHM